MKLEKFNRFVKSSYTLEIRQKNKLVFRSKQKGILGLLAFIKKHGQGYKNLIVFDKVVGQAAALLFVYLRVKEVFAFMGSQTAVMVLQRSKIKLHFLKIVPKILNKAKTDFCPMEKLSQGKTPPAFYRALTSCVDKKENDIIA